MTGFTRALDVGRLAIAMMALSVTGYWATSSLGAVLSQQLSGIVLTTPSRAEATESPPQATTGAAPPVARSAARPPTGQLGDAPVDVERVPWAVDPTGRTITDLGCARGLDVESVHDFVSGRLGPIVGWDNPHMYEIDEHRTLWLVHDTYVDYEGDLGRLSAAGEQMQNVAFLQEGRCFKLVHGGTPGEHSNFETGEGHVGLDRFLWPLGGARDGDRLQIFWSEMVRSPEPVVSGEGIIRHPNATWLATYDVETLERLSFEPAPNPGVSPIYGFAVESDAEFSYLFANTNLLNFAREGGFDNGPHSATKMYIARVPKGQLDAPPRYWDGAGWSVDPADAAIISERFWAENTMQPRYAAGQWVSVVKRDGFFGNEIVIDVADDPWGPWSEVERIPNEGTFDPDVPRTSYHPVIAPWSSVEVGLILIVSENAQEWSQAYEAIDVYRPTAIGTSWPFDDDGSSPERPLAVSSSSDGES